METLIVQGLALTIFLGIAAQWLAWRLRLPSILLLLVVGFLAGPIFGVLDPDAIFGRDIVFGSVSVAVSLILFEGGLTLRFRELEHAGGAVFRLITIGVLVTWVIATAAAVLLLDLPLELSLLLGAILTVTGPTVVGPLLRHIRPSAPAGTILKWEGILVDPIGAILAVLVFQAILEGGLRQAPSMMILGAFQSILIGAVIGGLGAVILIVALKKHWIPDALQSASAFALVVVASWTSNLLHHESGLVAVTLMGILLANQKHAPYRHILEFKENLRVLLISGLFILLAARLPIEDIRGVSIRGVLFVAVLILVARPLAVAASTFRSSLPVGVRVFVAWMAPRGIVAAAVTSVFSYRLAEQGYAHANELVPIVFLVIVGTVLVYGLTAFPIALRLSLAQKNPQGALIVGAHPFARSVGKLLKEQGFAVLMVDSNYRYAAIARMEGLRVWHGNILDEHADEEIDLAGIGRVFSMTPNDEANALASTHLRELFGRAEAYQLAADPGVDGKKAAIVSRDLRGRVLFSDTLTYNELQRLMTAGATLKTTKLTEKFSFEDFRQRYGDDARPLFAIQEGARKRLTPFVADSPTVPGVGSTLISLVRAEPATTTPPATKPEEAKSS